MTRVIHTGDTHIGYQQYHVPERRADFLAAFRRVAADAVDADVDAVVHAGDLFHDRRPDLEDILGTLEVLRTLDRADVPFLAVVGNHEAKRDAQWLDLFASLGLATRLGAAPVVVGSTAFYGLDYVPRSRREDLAYEFDPHDADHAALVAHGLFEPFDFADWDTAEVLDAASVAFDALLLGDNHAPDRAEVDDTWVTYCGSTERTSADERPERGYNIVTFDDGAVRITRRGISTRPFVFVDVELAPGEGADRVRQRVGEHDLADAVVVVTIDGEGDPVVPAEFEEYATGQGALVARVADHREVADDRDIEVSFAEPDEAVRERVRELGLSDAARTVDETVRAGEVADSNVRETVRSRVEAALEAGDLGVFEGAEETAGGPGGTVDEDDAADGTDDGRAEEAVEEEIVEPAPAGGPVDADLAAEADGSSVPEPEGGEEASSGGPAGRDQVSMEEFQ